MQRWNVTKDIQMILMERFHVMLHYIIGTSTPSLVCVCSVDFYF